MNNKQQSYNIIAKTDEYETSQVALWLYMKLLLGDSYPFKTTQLMLNDWLEHIS